MIEAFGNHALVLEQLAHAPRHGGAVVAEADHLDCNLAIGIRVVTEVDSGRSALAQLLDYPVFADLFHSG